MQLTETLTTNLRCHTFDVAFVVMAVSVNNKLTVARGYYHFQQASGVDQCRDYQIINMMRKNADTQTD